MNRWRVDTSMDDDPDKKRSAGKPRPLAVVSDCTSTIGYDCCRMLARDGYNLLVIGDDHEKVVRQSDILRDAFGINIRRIVADIRDQESLSMVENALENNNRNIDVLICNTGVTPPNFADSSFKQILDLIIHQLNTSIRFTRSVLPGMQINNSGSIIFIVSVFYMPPSLESILLSTASVYLSTLSRSLKGELFKRGSKIEVRTICPGLKYSSVQGDGNSGLTGFISGNVRDLNYDLERLWPAVPNI
ncbi:MAG: SDR family NAD(P)-dependent oxidoreductase [Candidatus Aegiribacteria sp.]|nr:SDR family NAD(P)-dependent oxidoreductase [Candidatus Aegiribacteria sp.]